MCRNKNVEGMVWGEEDSSDDIQAAEIVNGLIFAGEVDFLMLDLLWISVCNWGIAMFDEGCLKIEGLLLLFIIAPK